MIQTRKFIPLENNFSQRSPYNKAEVNAEPKTGVLGQVEEDGDNGGLWQTLRVTLIMRWWHGRVQSALTLHGCLNINSISQCVPRGRSDKTWSKQGKLF